MLMRNLTPAGLVILVHVLGATTPTIASTQLTLSEWQAFMLSEHSPTPGQGCFVASYPIQEWTAIPCRTTPPDNGSAGPFTIGNGYNDYVTNSPNYNYLSTTGSFTAESDVTSEYDSGLGSLFGVNDFTVQLNSNTYSYTYGGHLATAWEQFVYVTDPSDALGSILVEYWLFGYAKYGCPSGWTNDGSGNCYKNTNYLSESNLYVNAKQLTELSTSGTVTSTTDTVKACVSGTCYSNSGGDLVSLGSGSYWYNSEWNVFGKSMGGQAVFNTGSSLSVKITVDESPTYELSTTYTGESNNLGLGSYSTGTYTLAFSESN